MLLCLALQTFKATEKDFEYDSGLWASGPLSCWCGGWWVGDGSTAQRVFHPDWDQRKYGAGRVWKGEAQLNMERIQKAVHWLFQICKIPGWHAFMKIYSTRKGSMLSQLYEWSGGNGIERAALIKEWLRKKVAKGFLFYFTKNKPLHPSNNCLQHQVPQSYRLFCLHKVNNAGSKVSSDCMSSQALQLVLEWRSCGWRIALRTLGLMRLMDGQRRDGAFIPLSEQQCWCNLGSPLRDW